MSRPLRYLSRAVVAVVLVVACLAGYRAYSRPRATTDWDMAQAALAVGDRNTAVVHLRNVVRDNPNHGEAYLAVSKLFLEHADLNGRPSTYATNERAFPFLAQAGKLLPQNIAVQKELLTIYFDQGKIPEAIEVAGRISDRLPNDPDVVAARAHHAIAQYERAEKELANVLAAKQPAHFQAMELRAKIDDVSENATHLQKLFDDVLNRARPQAARNVAALNGREHAAMANLIRRAVTQAPDAATAERRMQSALDAWDALARVEADGEGQDRLIAQAAAEASWLSTAYRNQIAPHANVAAAAASATTAFDDRAEAIRQFAVAANCIDAPTRMISVRRAFECGDLMQAAELAAGGIERATSRSETCELHRTAGRLFVLARSAKADGHIQALRADREWAGFGMLLAGEQSLTVGKPQEALMYFRSALPLLGHSREVRAGLADAFVALGRWNEARAELSGLAQRAKRNDVEDDAMIGEPPHRALLLRLFETSPDLLDAGLANAALGIP